MNARTLSKGTE
jgi:hypothetical protein